MLKKRRHAPLLIARRKDAQRPGDERPASVALPVNKRRCAALQHAHLPVDEREREPSIMLLLADRITSIAFAGSGRLEAGVITAHCPVNEPAGPGPTTMPVPETLRPPAPAAVAAAEPPPRAPRASKLHRCVTWVRWEVVKKKSASAATEPRPELYLPVLPPP